ncbi:MAG TPA: DUF5715 family protein [Thermoanaerobaculia bacterium]|nr:DUF5715 family protein [Thermoanaerobaculia bacterium]
MPPRIAPRRARFTAAFVLAFFLLGTCGTLSLEPLSAQTLVGSPASMDRQNRAAEDEAFTYLRNPEDIEVFVRHGLLVYVPGNGEYQVDGASFPYARPEVKRFLEWMGHLERKSCGEPLVATSLVRPKSHQPRNASIHSVHPTGMAMDLRRSLRRACSSLLESTLLDLESRGILEATKERFPAHYHVALFPEAFSSYLLAIDGGRELPPIQTAGLSGPPVDSIAESAPSPGSVRSGNVPAGRTASRSAVHRVRRGETLSRIASHYGLSADSLRRANGLRGSKLFSGQRLRIPGAAAVASARSQAGKISVRWSGTKSAATKARTVRVGRGDTLSGIATRHGTTIASLRKVNGLRGNTVRAGQLLKVPSTSGAGSSSSISASRSSRTTSRTASASAGRRAAKRVRVGRGETLWQIAQRNGVSVASLKKANGLRSASVKAGQMLSIPAR